MSCPADLGRLLDDDALTRDERVELLEHVRGCDRCTAAMVSADPTRVFAMLALDTPPVDDLELLSERVAAEIAGAEVARRMISTPGWMSVAASLLLAGVFATYLWTRPMEIRETAELRPPAPAESAKPRAAGTVEWVTSPGTAQVMDFNVGEMQVVMIFDEAMDI